MPFREGRIYARHAAFYINKAGFHIDKRSDIAALFLERVYCHQLLSRHSSSIRYFRQVLAIISSYDFEGGIGEFQRRHHDKADDLRDGA